MPAIVITVPSWHSSGARLARNYGMSEKHVIALPIGNTFGESTEAIPKIRESAPAVVKQIAEALQEPVLAGRVVGR